MIRENIKITSSDGGEFESYLVTPKTTPSPGIIMVTDIFGVGPEFKQTCDDLANEGFVVSAPDIFWRTDDPGYIESNGDGKQRGIKRSQPRQKRIEDGVQDLADTAADLRSRAECNGHIAVIGFCYGGPYAIIGPARLGLDAGFSFHGSAVQDWTSELEQVQVPVSLHWGTDDDQAPPEVLEMFKQKAAEMDNLDLNLYSGVKHRYTAKSAPAWSESATANSFGRVFEVMNKLR